MKKPAVLLVALVVAFVAVIAVKEVRRGNPPTNTIQAPAPDQQAGNLVATPAERALDEARREGKPVVLSFRSSTCIPCKAMAEVVEELRSKFSDRVAFVDVSLDELSEMGLIEEYGIRVKPTTVLLSAEGKPLQTELGIWPAEELGARLEEVLQPDA